MVSLFSLLFFLSTLPLIIFFLFLLLFLLLFFLFLLLFLLRLFLLLLLLLLFLVSFNHFDFLITCNTSFLLAFILLRQAPEKIFDAKIDYMIETCDVMFPTIPVD